MIIAKMCKIDYKLQKVTKVKQNIIIVVVVCWEKKCRYNRD